MDFPPSLAANRPVPLSPPLRRLPSHTPSLLPHTYTQCHAPDPHCDPLAAAGIRARVVVVVVGEQQRRRPPRGRRVGCLDGRELEVRWWRAREEGPGTLRAGCCLRRSRVSAHCVDCIPGPGGGRETREERRTHTRAPDRLSTTATLSFFSHSAPAPDIDWDALTFGIDNVAPVSRQTQERRRGCARPP